MQQHILLSIPIFLVLVQTNARKLEAVSLRLEDFNTATNEWNTKLLSPVAWYDRIDEEESNDPKDRAFLTGRYGDVYDCSNNVVPDGAFLSIIGYDRRNINPDLRERLNRLEIHRVQDCEDDEPIEMSLELEGGWGGGEVGLEGETEPPNQQNQNFWVRYNNDPENTETELNGDEMEEERIYDPIEEEQPQNDDDSFRWISPEEAGFKKLRKRQAPPGSDEYEDGGDDDFVGGQPATNQAQIQNLPGMNFNTPQPNANQNRRPNIANLESLTPDSGSPREELDFGNRFDNPNQQNPMAFRRLTSDFETGFGDGEGLRPGDPLYWDPMDTPESEDENEVIRFPQVAQRRGNQFPIQFPQNNAPTENIQLPVIPDLTIQDLLANARAAAPRDTEEWLLEHEGHNNEPPLLHNVPPSHSDVKILFAEIWPEYQLGSNTSFRFVFDPYVLHDVII
ncbi:hypothetical protein TWF506_011143 [Arthrobotrys conoides]|uniref:Uncharacterized protein n=1 Tax=Arthrobotrys conoides TaxID=74498 RepID=A0AAN8RVB8_9PEZI